MDVQKLLNNKSNTWLIFDQKVSKKYDFVSDLISLRLYRRWCKSLAKAIPSAPHQRILDLACGTGLIPLAIHKEHQDQTYQYTGVDLSDEMLNIFRDKLSHHELSSQIELLREDATKLGLESNHYDAVTMACGIRNVGDTAAGLAEILRVLKPGGAVYFLEPAIPKSRFLRSIFLGYFRHIVPAVAGIFSTADAYRYFNQSVESFPHGEGFIEMIEEAGFERCEMRKLTLGAGALYIGYKSSENT